METLTYGRAPTGLRVFMLAAAMLGCNLLAVTAARAQGEEDSLWNRSNLLGDLGGVRTALGGYGITLGVQETETLLGNAAGGVKQGATMQGVATATLQIDTGKAFNLTGGTINISALQIHGRSLSSYYLDSLQSANGNEADDTTRLWEMWYEQVFASGGVDIKIGQQSIDQEFIISKCSALFVNTMAGWPLVPSVDLYAGGPAYPLSSLGARLQVKPADNQAFLIGIFDDNPSGGPFADNPQSLDAGGTRFNLDTGVLFIAEYQYAVNQPSLGEMAHGGEQPGLPGTYKIGGWVDTGKFPDSRGSAAMHWTNYSLYAIADQMIWQAAPDSARSVNLFARIMGAPDDRNLIAVSFNSGVTITAPFPGRDNDQVGIDIGVGKLSSGAAAAANASPGTEVLIEATYQYQVAPWWQVQPDIQYIINPGGGIASLVVSAQNLRNELVLGFRTTITF